MPFDLRPHQEAAVTKMHNGCILCGGVGVGKSHTAVGYYLQNEAPRNVYVITTAKKRDKQDWQFLWADVGMTANPETTMGALVTVDSWENIKKYEEVTDAFFIFDEQRLVGTGAWVKAFYKIAAANRWIMLSATPGDNWLDYVPVFRANGFIKNLTQFKEDHVVQRWTGRYYQVRGYRQVPKLVRWRNQLLVDMPYEKHTTRHHHDVAVSYDKDLVRELVKRRWHVYENRPLTDASELFRVMRKVVYTDSTRLTAVRGLLQKHPKLIVFYNFDYELEILRTLAQPNGFSLSETLKEQTLQDQDLTQDHVRVKTQTYASPKDATTNHVSETFSTHSDTGSTMPNFTSGQARSSSKESPIGPLKTSENPWNYLLSPAGLEANSPRTIRTSSSSEQTSTTSASAESSSEQQESRSSESEDSLQASFNRSNESWGVEQCAEQLESRSDPTSVLMSNGTSMQTSHSTPGTTFDSDTRGSETKSGVLSRGTSPEHKRTLRTNIGQTLPIASSSKECSDTRSKTGSGTGSSTTAAENASCVSDDTTDGSKTQTYQKENDQWKNHSSPETTSRLSSSNHSTDTETTSESASKKKDSLKKSISQRSSSTSRRKQDVSPTTSSSSSQPHFQVAEWNGHKHEAVPTTTSWVYLVQYVAGAEAWECTETDAMVFYSMPYSYKIWWQAHGRTDRLNTPFTDLHYYVLFGNSVIEKGVRASLKAKKSFNESAFMSKLKLF